MLKIGHRGAKAYAPENTLSSFRKALDMGVDMIEFDVRITSDKHPVVIHDRTLRRVAKEYHRVRKITLKDLKKFRVGKNEKIPTLAEVLEILDSKIGINIELKTLGSAQIVVQTLRDYKVDMSSVMISSNHPTEIKVVEKLEPEITTALIFRSPNFLSIWFFIDFIAIILLPITKYYISWLVKSSHADYLNINHRLLDKKKMKLFKQQGVKICVWTVNSKKKIEYFKKLGVDGIITNYPDRL